MHDITIPLMGFNGFHHAGNKDSFDNFIGRESILDKLKLWLTAESDFIQEKNIDKKRFSGNYSGAYLITGFRGMGKSAFVHKAIKDIKDNKKNKNHYVPISINVGNDMLTSKELLYIICKLLSVNFHENTQWLNLIKSGAIKSKLNLLAVRLLMLILAISFAILPVSKNHIVNKVPSDLCINNAINNAIINADTAINSSFLDSICMWTTNHYYLLLAIVFFLACYFMPYFFHLLWKLTGSPFFITTWQIKRVFRHLNERIDSELTETTENGIDSNIDNKQPQLGINFRFLKSKKNVYPIAQTSEIQDLLVRQLDMIKKLPGTNFRFIFIIDELDKVSPEDIEKQIIPEYNSANVVNGNSTYNSRQRAFVSLLANMKYFISSSEAKFVFITGYDMYEATLADISNREFNIHSIFNGYINVSSFLRKTGKSTGADSLIEEYFCHMLMANCNGIDDKRKDLNDYADYFRRQWKNNKLDKNTLSQYELLLERRINFLRHFLTYLFYMSNGSPKKLAMYLEKYIRSKKRTAEQIEIKSQKDNELEYKDIALGVTDCWEKCNWFLYFDIRNIQKIEFINYLIYPMIKNLIAKSSIYNDKLLVATSFMISNLYKFHKSGFSWRNLEYMPELLDINKMPELRDFIGGIMQFLNQTHIDETVANLYKFKFPQRLSEEITYFSKTAEEISYLFNFSHDELLSIKKLYHQEIEHYNDPLNESPALASIHHMLGDIYILEESYEQAIFEYHEALTSISKQIQDNPNHDDESSNLLFKTRVTLKLGLAYEKRKTFDTAYITYENLVKQIVDVAQKTRQTGSYNIQSSQFDIIDVLEKCSSFFFNIRITYLAILAKIAVLEKMDLGGIRELDLLRLHKEFEPIVHHLSKEIRPIAVIDFYTKLGDILFYKNGSFSCKENNDFIDVVKQFRLQLGLSKDYINKFDMCQVFLMQANDMEKHSRRANAPCMACQCFNRALKSCFEELNENRNNYNQKSRSLFFLNHLYDDDLSTDFIKRGNIFMMAMACALVGMGNTLLGCIKDSPNFKIEDFFYQLYVLLHKTGSNVKQEIKDNLELMDINHYAKSILYYLSSAKTYELLTDYKAAYNIYIQILDAVIIYHQSLNKVVDNKTLLFCKRITEIAIQCTFLHYDSINCAEVDTIKYEMGLELIEHINLHTLTNYPEIEILVNKYYQICLNGNKASRDKVLIKILNSKQLGCYKLIATLTQNVQNLYFKILVNEEILSRIMPDLWQSLSQQNFFMDKTLRLIADYYVYGSPTTIDDLFERLDWGLVNKSMSDKDKRFVLLDYLLKDSLFCLNMITELIDPLYSTTLYSNTFIGEIFNKSFYWNHILICIREIIGFTEQKDSNDYGQDFLKRYDLNRDTFDFRTMVSALEDCRKFLLKLKSWHNYSHSGLSRIESIYQKINPGGNYNHYLTSSYLTGNAIDRYSRAIEMHNSGKTYKEMMTTLFFLEDDLHNDSNYLNIAVERFLINHGVVQERLQFLKEYSARESSLLQIDNYVKQ